MRSVSNPWASARRFGAAGAALFLSLLSCGREVTGPADGVRIATGLSFVAEFPEAISNLEQGAGDVVPFNRVRVIFTRTDESIAYDQILSFGASTDSLPLTLNIALSPDAPAEGESLSLFLRYLNADGDTVFSGGPVQVLAVPRRRGDPPPQPAQVPLEYTGPGAEAVSVELTPDTLNIIAGDPFAFSAVARDGQGGVVSTAPIIYSALDDTKAPLTSIAAATGTSLATRGIARVRAVLAATGAADTAVLNIAPKPASLQRLGLIALAGPTNSVLADSVVVRLLATDNGPIENEVVTVTIEGGGGVNDTTLITDANGRAAVQWTLGATVGVAAQRLKFNSTGVPELIVTATATAPLLGASRLAITQQPSSAAISLVNLTPALIVEARDSSNALVTSFEGMVDIGVRVGPDGGAVIGISQVQAVGGVATFSAFSLDAVGVYNLEVTSGALASDTTNAITVSAGSPALLTLDTGGGQTALVGAPLPTPISVIVRDAANNRVPDAEVAFSVTAGGGSLSGATAISDAVGIATLGGWTLGPIAGTQSITAAAAGANPLQIDATALPLAPVIALNVVGANVIGFQRTGDIRVKLMQPAPIGGLTVSVISDSTQFLTIAAPGNVTIPAGDTSATIGVTGINVGTAVVRATGAGYTPDTLEVPVSLNLISLPTTLDVSLAGTVSLPVQLSAPAPAGGVVVKLTSSASGTVGLVTDSVVIAAGTQSANATLQGVTLGSATVTATNPNYSPDATTVTVTAAINIQQATLSINASFGLPMTVQLLNGAIPVAAPAGGVALTFEAVNPACVSVPSAGTITAGFADIDVQVVAAAGGTFPCSSFVRARGPAGFISDSVNVLVAVTPAITAPTTQFIGAGLQRSNSISLGATNHGGTSVRIESTDPSRLLIAPNANSAGAAFIDVPFVIGANTGSFVIQALEDGTPDTVLVRLTAPGFVSDSFPTFVHQAAFDIPTFATTRTTAATDTPFAIRVGSTSTPTSPTIGSLDAIRFGGTPLVFSVLNDSAGVIDLVTTALTGDSASVTIAVLTAASPSTVAAGGIAVRSQGPGTTTVRATHPTLRALATAVRSVTVTEATISSVSGMSGASSIARGLQRNVSITLSNAAPTGGVPLTVKPSRPGFVLLSSSPTLVGSPDSVVLTVAQAVSSATITVQILEGAALDTLSLLLSAPGFGTFVAPVQVIEPALQIANDLATTATVGTADDLFRAQVGSTAGPLGASIVNSDVVRRGGGGMIVSVINDNPAAGTLVTTAGVADSVDILIPEGAGFSGSLVSNGGVAYRFLAQGVSTVRAQSPVTRELAGATRTVTVTQPSISSVASFGLGAGLQRTGTVSLDTPAPIGGLPVTLKVDVPGRVLFAPNATTVGSDSIVLTIAAGATSASYILQALEVAPDTVVLTASAPGYTSRTANLFVWTPLLDLISFLTSYNTLSGDDPFAVRVGTGNSPVATAISSVDERRFGATPLTATIVSSNGLVGRLVTQAITADTVTAEIVAGQSTTPSSVVIGGFAFRPLTSGTTVISATIPGFTQAASAVGSTITVLTPAINITGATEVGAGLQIGKTGSLTASQHGGINIVIKSSNPSIMKVARLATDIATDSIILPIANGVQTFSYIVAAQDGVTGSVNILASAPGFTDGSAVVSAVVPAIELQFLATTAVAGGADDHFTVRLGTANVSFTSITSPMAVRIGSPGLVVTISSSNPTAGLLVTSSDTLGTVSLTIPPGSSSTGSSVAANGVAFRPAAAGVTLVQPSAPGFTRTSSTGNVTVTVNP